MTNKVGIGVEAQFDTSGIERALNSLGDKIAAANKLKFTPFSGKTQAELDAMLKKFEQLRKIHGDLNKRLNATGQGGASLLTANYDLMYPDPNARARVMRKIYEYSTGTVFSGGGSGGGGKLPPSPPSAPPPGRPNGGPGWGGMASQVAQAGLRAAGPAGGVAAGALGTGMSAGFGAGLMGLMGGMLALGIGKIVGAAAEKIGQAEDNAVALDTLKRTLGDVNVSFAALKAVVHSGADNLRITYAESERLASSFVKLGNVTGDQYKTLNDELGVGVGLSRAFGLDPSQGMGVLGRMRGIGATSDAQESRRFALLIGETIGKSGAFAKADEVMEALANYTTSQTRNNMGVANVAGYAGLFSGLVGSGIPGLDPAGAAGLIGRVNSSLMAGGAKGEASQFFTAMVGARMGLDPIMTQMLREGGAFATNDQMFGQDSVYSKFMGRTGPTGSTTVLQGTLDMLRQQYGGNKGMLAQATANHLGIGINQAMALLSVKPNEIGEMQQYGDLSKLSGSGIGNLSKALYGSDDERKALANSLLSRSDVSEEDKSRLRGAMGTSSERDVLATLTAQYEQERTTGSDIRDSKNALDNIKVSLADKLIPLTQAMRDGIIYMAGKGEKSRLQVMTDIENLESRDRKAVIDAEFDSRRKAAGKELAAARKAVNDLWEKNRPLVLSGAMTQEQHAAEMKPLQERERRATEGDAEAREWHAKALEDERKLLEKNIENIKKANAAENAPPSTSNQSAAETARLARMGRSPAGSSTAVRSHFSTGGGGALANDPNLRAAVSAAEREIGAPPGLLWAQMGVESNYNPNAVSPAGAMGLAQVMPATLAALERRLGRKLNPNDPSDAVLIQKEVMRENYGRFGNWGDALRAYNGGWNQRRWNNPETRAYVPKIMDRMGQGTPLPEGRTPDGGDKRFIFDAAPLEIIHRNERGEMMGAPQSLATRITPLGTERMRA